MEIKARNVMDYTSQQGFTLIELMIALLLGLLISAAVMQVYLVSARTSVIQQSGSNIVDASVFGFQNIQRNIKLANLGLADSATGTKRESGIVISNSNIAGIKLSDNKDIDLALLTRGQEDTEGSGNMWTGKSNTDKKSDQLTIQYRAPQNMFDCEGQSVLGPRTVKVGGVDKLIDGQIVIERYFLRESNDSLGLACDAGRYITEDMDDYDEQHGDNAATINQFSTKNRVNGFGDAGSILMNNIDDFQVLLGVLTADGMQYLTSTDYLTESPNQPIVAVKLGMIARGDRALPGGQEASTTFDVLGVTTGLGSDESASIIRRVYEANVMLRNARQL